MGHISIPNGATFPTESPTAAAWGYQGNAGNADVWATEVSASNSAWLSVKFRPGHHFTDAGVTAALGQANTYLVAAKITAVGIARHIVGFDAANMDFNYVDVNRKSLSYVVAAADVAAQVTAILAILNTGANVA